jgi:hypothetical protein
VRLDFGTAAATGLLYQPRMIGDDDCGEIGGMKIDTGKPKYSEQTCTSATLSTTNPTWLVPGMNLCHRGGKPAINCFLLLLLFGLWGYWHCGQSWPIVPASGDSEDDCGEADGI